MWLACLVVSTARAAHVEEAVEASGEGRAQMAGRIGRCFVLGAVLGTLLDGIHAYGDVLVYP